MASAASKKHVAIIAVVVLLASLILLMLLSQMKRGGAVQQVFLPAVPVAVNPHPSQQPWLFSSGSREGFYGNNKGGKKK